MTYDISWLPELTEQQQAEALGIHVDELAGRGNAETLRRYWTEGEGAAKIRWGVGGDFYRCVRHLAKYVSDPKGYCSDMHKRATGARPGHAAGEAAMPEELDLNEAGKIYHWKHGWIPLDHEAAKNELSVDALQHGDVFSRPGSSQKYTVHNASDPANLQAVDSDGHLVTLNMQGGDRVSIHNRTFDPTEKSKDDASMSSKAKPNPPGHMKSMAASKKSPPEGHMKSMAASNKRPRKESAAMDNQIHESVTFSERAVQGTSGRWEVTVISAGLGSSGYYAPEVLERAAANKLIESGTPLFFDHPGESERSERPERSVRDIAAVFTGPTRYDSRGQRLVGEVQIFKPYRELVNEMAPHIGLSISGSATDITEGTIEGRKVPVVEDLHDIFSVDLVTKAGRGGQFVSLLESAREQMDHLYEHAEEGAMTQEPSPDPQTTPQEPDPAGAQPDPTPETAPTPTPSQEEHMTDTPQGAGGDTPAAAPTQEAAAPVRPRNPREVMENQLREQGRQIALLRAENVARDIVAEVLTTGWIGDQQRARLTASLVRDLPLTESGELDTGALRETAQSALDEAETEAAEILQAAGVGSPRGLGALETPATEAAGKQFEDELRESMKQRGMSDAAIEIAVKGR